MELDWLGKAKLTNSACPGLHWAGFLGVGEQMQETGSSRERTNRSGNQPKIKTYKCPDPIPGVAHHAESR